MDLFWNGSESEAYNVGIGVVLPFKRGFSESSGTTAAALDNEVTTTRGMLSCPYHCFGRGQQNAG